MSRTNSAAQKESRSNTSFVTPKGYILIVLFFIAGLTGLNTVGYHGYINAGAAIATAVVMDLIGGLLRKRKRLMPDGAIITALIITLVLNAAVTWQIAAATAAIAIGSKHLLQVKKKPIFNPAAFGLLAALLFFSSEQDWWGGFSLFPSWCIVYVIIGGYIVTNRSNKFPQVFAFLGVYFILFLAMAIWKIGDVSEAFRIPFINSALFLAFFMVTDPPTSPGKYKDQIIFGSIAAIVSVAIDASVGGLYYLLAGLLAANLWNAWKLKRSDKRRLINIITSS
jgi:Na+-translocating ferredoxin:NAD+ oxidoreductase RnfD subunit